MYICDQMTDLNQKRVKIKVNGFVIGVESMVPSSFDSCAVVRMVVFDWRSFVVLNFVVFAAVLIAVIALIYQ